MIMKHKDLVNVGRKILITKGFAETDIFEEYNIRIGDHLRRIDIVGISKEKKVAIECGHSPMGIDELKPYFDETIIIPFVTNKGNIYYCAGCNHNWSARKECPKECPKCKRYFNLVDSQSEVIV